MIQTVVFIGQDTTWADITYDIVLPSSFVNSLDYSYLSSGPITGSTQAFAVAQQGGGGSGLPLTTVVSGFLTYQTDSSYAGDGQWLVNTYWARTGDPIYAVDHYTGNDQDGYQTIYELNLAPSSYDGMLPYESWIDRPLVSFVTDNTQIVSTTTSYQEITLTDHSEELILEGPARIDAGGGIDRISLASGAGGSTIAYTSLADLTGAALTDGLYGDNNAQPFEQIIGFGSPDAGTTNRIDLSALSGFTYIGSGTFSATGHAEVRFEADAYSNDPEFAGQGQWGGWSLLQFDANGDGQIDYRVGLLQSGTAFQILYETAPGSLILQTNPPDVSADQPPMITSDGGGETAAVSVDENTAAVTTVTATDPDPGDTLTFSIAGGADAALFKIDGQTGELSFIEAPDYEKPKDVGLDNVYDVTVQATDTSGSFAAQDISVTVNDFVGITASGDGVLIGTNEEDTLIGGSGSTRFVGNAGNDYMDGGPGNDTVDYGSETGPNGVYVNLLGRGQYTDLVGPDGNVMAPDTAFDTWGDLDSIPNIPNVIGTAHDDVIYGGNHDNVLLGGAGDDILLGGGRNDTIDGGDGIDTAIYRGNRSDYTVTANADGSVTIADLRPDPVDTVNNIRNDGTDTVRNVEFFQFADIKLGFNDLLVPPPQVTAGLAHDTGSSSSDGITNDPALAGTGDPNAVVHFTVDGNPINATATADASGAWAFTPSGLSDGGHTIIASETNAGGTNTASLTFTLDTATPPVTEALVSDTGVSASDGITSNLALAGAGDPYAVVSLAITGPKGTTGVVTTTADANGLWSFQQAKAPVDGAYTITASETDAAGNTGTASHSFILDTSAPVIADVLQAQVSKKLATTTMSGQSETGDVITLYEGANALGSATAGADGKWSISLANLSNTVHTITTADLAGNSAPTVILGTSGADKIAAPATGGVVIGGAGTDTLAAGAGSDFFMFHNGFGKDTITNFDLHHDSLVFGADLPLFDSFSSVMAHVSDYSTKKDGFVGAVITYDKGDTITLAGVHAADLTAANFNFIQSGFGV